MAKSKDEQQVTGLHWLKYAGVGPSRSRGQRAGGRVSGEDVTSLGSLEAEVMGILWEIGHPASSMDVMETSLYKRRGQGQEPASFATIATTLRRLTEKGLLQSEKNEARTPYYYPTVGREEMAARILNNVSVTLLGSSLHGLLPKLVGNVGQAPVSAEEKDDVDRLMKAIEDAAGSAAKKRGE